MSKTNSLNSSYLSNKSTVISMNNNPIVNKILIQENIQNNSDKKLKYKLIKKIGQGTFGKVYLSKIIDENNKEIKVAIKQIYNDHTFYNREVEINKVILIDNHPNILKMLDKYYENNITNIVMEYMPENFKSLLNKLSSNNLRLKLSNAIKYMYQLANALCYIHKKNILHRDLKPENILINPINNTLKLCDFGSAKMITTNDINCTYIVSRFYRAPELILDRNLYDCKIDIWSYGCILCEITLGYPIFIGNDNVEMLVEIIKVLGSIKHEDILSMKRDIEDTKVFKFPSRNAIKWNKVFNVNVNSINKIVDVSYGLKYEKLVSSILLWKPCDRFNAQQIMNSDFFES